MNEIQCERLLRATLARTVRGMEGPTALARSAQARWRRRRRNRAIGLVSVAVVVAALAVVKGPPAVSTLVASGPSRGGHECTEGLAGQTIPSMEQLKRMKVDHAWVCQWRTEPPGQHERQRLTTQAELTKPEVRRVLAATQRGRQVTPGCAMFDSYPPRYSTVTLVDEQSRQWQYLVPARECLGYVLSADGSEGQLSYVNPRLGKLLIALASS